MNMFENSLSSLARLFSTRSDSGSGPLPRWVARTSEYGLYALLTGCTLMGIAFLTNPVPDPSFPWATLPESFRFSYTQPRIKHWSVTYTIGLWLIVFTFPILILQVYQQYGSDSRFSASSWLVGVPVSAMLALTTYCRFSGQNSIPRHGTHPRPRSCAGPTARRMFQHGAIWHTLLLFSVLERPISPTEAHRERSMV